MMEKTTPPGRAFKLAPIDDDTNRAIFSGVGLSITRIAAGTTDVIFKRMLARDTILLAITILDVVLVTSFASSFSASFVALAGSPIAIVPVLTYLSHNFTVANGLRVNGTTTSNDYSGGIWGKTNDVATNNTTDTWVPVMSGTKWQHRAIPTTYNSTAPTLTGLTLNGDNGSNNITKSGVIENQTSFESDTFKKQSFVGSTNVSGTWYNIINCRHRNGGGDGTNFGMQIRKKLTSNGALEIRTQLASTTWTSWQRIPVEFVLYDNSTGTNGNVTLSETAANFTYIEIYFRDNNSSEFHCEKIYSPNGKSTTIGFIRNYADSGGVLYSYLFSKYITISGTTITNVRNDYTQFRAKVVNDHNANNNVYIFRVVGYR